MRALITGITGFVGSHLAEHLLECGDEVAGISRQGVGPSELPASARSRVRVYPADLAEGIPGPVRRDLAAWRPEVVFHLAALSVPGECGEDRPSSAAMASNVGATRHLVEWLGTWPRPPRVVFSSSCYVYGIVSPQQPVVAEEVAPHPQSGYGITKWQAEQVLLEAVQAGRLDAVIARAFQHTGPRQSPRMIVPEWARQLVTPSDAPIRAICLDTYIDLSDVRDIVRAYRLLATAGKTGRIYNVGSGTGRRSGDLLDQLQALSGTSRPVVELSPGRRQHPIADITRITSEILWRPVITIEHTLRDVLAYWHHTGSKVRP